MIGDLGWNAHPTPPPDPFGEPLLEQQRRSYLAEGAARGLNRRPPAMPLSDEQLRRIEAEREYRDEEIRLTAELPEVRRECQRLAAELLSTATEQAAGVFVEVEIPPRLPFMALKHGWVRVDSAWPVGFCAWRYRLPMSEWDRREEAVGLTRDGELDRTGLARVPRSPET